MGFSKKRNLSIEELKLCLSGDRTELNELEKARKILKKDLIDIDKEIEKAIKRLDKSLDISIQWLDKNDDKWRLKLAEYLKDK
jgi:DNA-binding transcriptional MerR regulator